MAEHEMRLAKYSKNATEFDTDLIAQYAENKANEYNTLQKLHLILITMEDDELAEEDRKYIEAQRARYA